jgi:hypothetical protein
MLNNMPSKTPNGIRIIAAIYIIVLPALFFPTLSAFSLLADWIFGSGEQVVAILYGPKNELLNQFVTDWLYSLPFTAIISWLVFTPVYFFLTRKHISEFINPMLSSMIVWLAAGVFLYQQNIPGIILSGVSGLLIGAGMVLSKRLPRRGRRTT